MIVNLTGVLEEGGPRGAGVPDNARKFLSIPRATDVIVKLTVLSSLGGDVDMTGATGKLVIKKRSSDGAEVASLSGALRPTEGISRMDFAFVPATTKDQLAGRYVFDISITRSGLVDVVIPLSPCFLEPTLQ